MAILLVPGKSSIEDELVADAEKYTSLEDAPLLGCCGNGHVGPTDTVCTQDGCGKLFMNSH